MRDAAAVRALLDRNPSSVAERESEHFRTPLHFAAEVGRLAVVKRLLSLGASPHDVASDGNTLLHVASLGGKAEVVRELIGRGLPVGARNDFGRTPLHLAELRSQARVAELLVSTGASRSPRAFIAPKGPYLGQKPSGARPGVFAPGIVSTEGHEFAITFSADFSEIWFTRRSGDRGLPTDTFLMTRSVDGRRTEPAVAWFSGRLFDCEPHVTPDGRRLLFGSDRPDRPGGTPGPVRECGPFAHSSGLV